jgi:hypothetical protein
VLTSSKEKLRDECLSVCMGREPRRFALICLLVCRSGQYYSILYMHYIVFKNPVALM